MRVSRRCFAQRKSELSSDLIDEDDDDDGVDDDDDGDDEYVTPLY